MAGNGYDGYLRQANLAGNLFLEQTYALAGLHEPGKLARLCPAVAQDGEVECALGCIDNGACGGDGVFSDLFAG